MALSAGLIVYDGFLTGLWFVIGEVDLWDVLGEIGVFGLVVGGQLGAMILWLGMVAAVLVKRAPVERG